MASHMKTTVHIPDALFAAAQRIAAKEKTTLKALVQEGLQDVVARHGKKVPFKLRDASVAGSGLNPEVKGAHWNDIASIIYEGRGG